ncbi:glucose dehydrogenase [FAD, quinone]-like [Hetaerina americana]|uniref:glucose dehydrogenase [FAD, quinone]-like n=1 Tax=Hetaerina americana TaxID=62018 RepID=UPI003A7F47E3
MTCCGSGVTPSGAAATLFLSAISSLTNMQCEIGNTDIYPKSSDLEKHYNFIVIGAGTAGCVVANRLSKDPKNKVLLLESGGDPPYTSEVPAFTDSLHNTEADWSYESDGKGHYCLGMVGHKCRWSEGKALGGSTVLNSMVYLRGNPKDYMRWAKEGNEGWDYDHMVKYFEKSEGKVTDGDEGHLTLEPFDGGDLPLLYPLASAAGELGNRVSYDNELLADLGFFFPLGTLRNGTRYSAAKSYLAPVKYRKNLHIVKNADVLRILFNHKKRAVGVELLKGGSKFIVSAEQEIIISAGAFASAKLLMLSGVGPREHLAKFGIKSVADLPVGENMHGHVRMPGIVASINRGVVVSENSQKEMIEKVVNYLVSKTGQLSGIGYGKFTGFINSSKHGHKHPINQVKFAYYTKGDTETLYTALSALNYDKEIINSYTSLLKEADILVVDIVLQQSRSRGRMLLASSDPLDKPLIVPNLFEDIADEQALLEGIAEGMKLTRTCALKSAARVEPRVLLKRCLRKGWRPGKSSPSGNIDDSPLMSLDYWRCAVRKIAAPEFLPVGTCKMGPSHKHSVVDSRLRVHLVKGLRVIDAAIMPTITTGETVGAVVALAEKGATMIKEDWRH